ncbi:MAG: SHOCT domain-containing protein [Hyphomicrobiaceae bacterium]
MMYGYGLGGSWIGMGLWWIVLIVIVGLLLWGVTGSGSTPPANESALEVLKKRYARGEINREEFEQKKRDLDA